MRKTGKLEGEEQDKQVSKGIHLMGVESTQGGVAIRDNEGMGINLEDVKTRHDMVVSNNKGDGTSGDSSIINLSSVDAGGNVTVNTGVISTTVVDHPTINIIPPTPLLRVYDSLHQLPTPPADFVGREKEITELLEKVRKGGVTISGMHGMGGVGKTALALILAEALSPAYADAQIYLDLKGVDLEPLKPTDVMAHVIHSFHADAKLPDDEVSLVSLYRTILHGQKCLLLMDNAKDAGQVEPLIPPKSCLLIVTSRSHFILPGMDGLNLEALPEEDAIKLLLEIAPRIGKAAPEIVDLCCRIPLALRVVASLMRERMDLTVEKILKRLKDEQKRLKVSDMERVLKVSYELLTSESQKGLRSLAVLGGSFDSGAAAAVWEMDEEAADKILGELIKTSLLEFDTKSERYGLHDLVRLFAGQQMDEKEAFVAYLRHAQYYCDVLSQADALYRKGSESILQGLTLFDREWANISAGQAWAKMQIDTDETSAKLAMKFPIIGSSCIYVRLHPKQQIEWLETSLVVAHKLGNLHDEGIALANLGNAYTNLGESKRAIEIYEFALLVARKIGNHHTEGNILGNLGTALISLGEYKRAIHFLKLSLVIVHEVGNRPNEINILGNLGFAHANLGEIRQAIEFYEQALAIAHEIGDRRGEGQTLGVLGNAYAALGEITRAIEFYRKHLTIAQEMADRRAEGSSLWALGIAYALLGETRQAIEFYENALIIEQEIGDRRCKGDILGNLGNAHNDLGEYKRAIEFYEQALEIEKEVGDRRGEGNTLGNLGSVYFNIGEIRLAIEFFEQAIVIKHEISDWAGECSTSWNLGVIYDQIGEFDKAANLMQIGADYERSINHPEAQKSEAIVNKIREKAKCSRD